MNGACWLYGKVFGLLCPTSQNIRLSACAPLNDVHVMTSRGLQEMLVNNNDIKYCNRFSRRHRGLARAWTRRKKARRSTPQSPTNQTMPSFMKVKFGAQNQLV